MRVNLKAWNLKMRELKPVNFERYEILDGEWMVIVRGFVMVCSCAILQINGFVTVDGLIKVG